MSDRPKEADLVVVGGGVAAYTAALAAIQNSPSASVRLLCPADDRFRSHSGLIDVLGYLPDEADPVSDPVAAVESLPAEHWYTKLGEQQLQDALATFDSATGDRYRGAEANALFPTAVGTLKPAARYPAAFAAGTASNRQPMRLIGFDALADFDAALAADRLGDTLPYDVASSSVPIPISVDSVPAAPAVAETLDTNTAVESGDSARESLAQSLRSKLDIEPRLGVPAVLGEQDTAEIHAELADSLSVALFEVPIGPPSVPGKRLERELTTALTEAGVSVDRGVSLSGIDATEGVIDAVRTAEEGYGGSAFVLATGGIQAGGLVSTRREIREPLFGCPVSAPDSRREWVDDTFLGDHEAVRVGVDTDEQLRPTGRDGSHYSNLHAAGRVLECTNVIAEQSSDGHAIATGYEAGLRAIEQT